MTSLSGIGSGMTMTSYHRPKLSTEQAAQMAQNLFAKLDTSNQGYLTSSDLQSAIGGTSDTTATTATASADKLFTSLDTNGDGKVTKDEFTDVLTSLAQSLSSKAASQGTQGAQDGFAGPGGAGSPPPPPDGDAGFTKDQLTTKLSEIGSTDSRGSSVISDIIKNFDAADTNGDGKVSGAEAMAYEQKQATSTSSTASTASSTSSSSSTSATDQSSSDRQLLRQILRLMQAYGVMPDNSSATTASVSATA